MVVTMRRRRRRRHELFTFTMLCTYLFGPVLEQQRDALQKTYNIVMLSKTGKEKT